MIRVMIKHRKNEHPAAVARLAIISLLAILAPACWSETAATGPGALLGIFHEGSQDNLGPVRATEEKIGGRFASVMWYTDWSTPFPTEAAKRVSKAGYMPHITWEAWFFADQSKVKLDDVIAGKWDGYIRDWAKGAARFGQPMLLRIGHEFNGNWYPWSVSANGNDPSMYVAFYRRVHDIFLDAGADNVSWIWCYNATSVPNEEWNAPMKAYPGDDYVDWVGLDGYNFSGSDSFKDIFAKAYSTAVTETSKPIMVAEFATGDRSVAKAKWIRQTGEDLAEFFPAIRAITWFDINKEQDWRLIPDAISANAARDAFGSDYFLRDPALFSKIPADYPGNLASYREAVSVLVPPKVTNEIGAIAVPEGATLEAAAALLAKEGGVRLVSANGAKDLSGTMSVGWSKSGIYALATLTDDDPIQNKKKYGDMWNGDCVEFCVSLDPNADPARAFYTATDLQVGLSPGNGARVKPSAWVWGNPARAPKGATVTATPSKDGYVLAAFVPWKDLVPGFQAENGMRLGFDFAFDDAGPGGDRESQTVWNGDSSFYANPAQWGILILR